MQLIGNKMFILDGARAISNKVLKWVWRGAERRPGSEWGGVRTRIGGCRQPGAADNEGADIRRSVPKPDPVTIVEQF